MASRPALIAWALLLIAACSLTATEAHNHRSWQVRHGCTGFPANPGSKPGCSNKWTCNGLTCTAKCDWGAPAQAVCLPTGVWNITVPCQQQVCNTPPPNPTCGSAFFGDCRGKTTCFGFCSAGFTGTVKAECHNGAWVVSNTCQRVPSKPMGCAGLPTSVQGIAWDNRCQGKTYCGSNCLPGYTGYVYSKCVNGKWTPPTGQCLPKTQQGCWGMLPAMPNATPWCATCLGKTTCSTQCSSSCSGGGYTATCVNGQWLIKGSCSTGAFGWRRRL